MTWMTCNLTRVHPKGWGFNGPAEKKKNAALLPLNVSLHIFFWGGVSFEEKSV